MRLATILALLFLALAGGCGGGPAPTCPDPCCGDPCCGDPCCGDPSCLHAKATDPSRATSVEAVTTPAPGDASSSSDRPTK